MIISVIGLYRNSENYVRNTLACLNKLSELGNFDFYFYENDSIDGTKKILEEWIESKPGQLLSENIGSPHFGSVPNVERLVLLSYYRNKARSLMQKAVSEYTLLIDTDIIFDNENFLSLYNFMQSNANCAMAVANTRQYQIGDLMNGETSDSFYDVFALRDEFNNNCLYFTDCPFVLNEHREKWKNNDPIKIKTGFSGFSLIRTDILKKNNCTWSTCGHVEHVNFCYSVAKYGDIYILPYCKPTTKINLSSINIDVCKEIAQKQLSHIKEINYIYNLSKANNITIK